jgi:hypothetical protein
MIPVSVVGAARKNAPTVSMTKKKHLQPLSSIRMAALIIVMAAAICVPADQLPISVTTRVGCRPTGNELANQSSWERFICLACQSKRVMTDETFPFFSSFQHRKATYSMSGQLVAIFLQQLIQRRSVSVFTSLI